VNQPLPEVHIGPARADEPELPLAADGVLRYVWHSKFGDLLVEVHDGAAFVNGQKVEPAPTETRSAQSATGA
jgi:hypothetical protein